ncbi:hypothetical protein [Paenibacillus amylolyticus]|uniref:hypothetical protein n=1 Tax=Paenibacillus amylolyticus TaxID=1451 RepID=UPI00286ADA16|nr:hypothetical protein [Paenibacillus amylolyticus]
MLDVYVAESFDGGSTFTKSKTDYDILYPNGNSPTPIILIRDYITAYIQEADKLVAVWMATTPPTGKLDIYFGT